MPLKRAGWLAAGLLASAALTATGQTPSFSIEAQQRLLGPSGPGAAETLARRRQLVAEGEARLAAGDAAAALQAFESAAAIVHAADVELGLVRSYMQAGEYRRALGFGAHAAGAHRELPGGMALYAWLLHAGGQRQFAQRMLDEWLVRSPDDPALKRARRELLSPAPRVDGVLASAPIRIAPGADPGPSATAAAVVGSAVLMADARSAVAPASLLDGAKRIWVRNGLGQTAEATVTKHLDEAGLLMISLDHPLAVPMPWQAAPTSPPAGSPSYLVEFATSADAAPAWPMLHAGFFGRQGDSQSARPLGIDMPQGPHGGPVFDRFGRLAGIAVPMADGGGRLVSVEVFDLPPAGREMPASAATANAATTLDAIYEAALRLSLQLIVER